MTINLRRLFIGLVVLAGLLGAYLLYARVSGTPPIDVNGVESSSDLSRVGAADANAADVGTIADVDVLALKRTTLAHRNANNEVDREFGFEELLHRDSDQWEITYPFMKLYLPDFRCEVTADRGRVELKTAYEQLVPDDAVFEGNVVIHVIPLDPNDPVECFIYLDDVSFIADQSLFSSRGPVTFLSRAARLTGTGIELLYDSARSRLELFRIVQLNSLRLRSDRFDSMSLATAADTPDATTDRPPRQPAGRPAARAASPGADVYACVFRENVRITTPEQAIEAREWLAINNILWSGETEPEEANEPTVTPADPKAERSAPPPVREPLDTSPSRHLALDSIAEEFYDIVVTCDGGFVVAPAGSPRFATEPTAADKVTPAGAPPPSESPTSRQRAGARGIEFDVATSDATLVGPVEMAFVLDPNELTAGAATGELMPVTISAQRYVRFIAASNRILFDGACRATVRQTEPNATTDYELTAPAFTLELVDVNDGAGLPSFAVRRFAAGGGQATVFVHRRDGAEPIGATEIFASRLDYDAERQFFIAYGPGMVTVHNARAPTEPLDPNVPSLDQPCYALLRDFDRLVYSTSFHQVVAESESGRLLIDYIPVVDGEYGDAISAYAGFIEISLAETAAGRVDLAAVTASRGVGYKDAETTFRGQVFFYDHVTSVVTVEGGQDHPCYLNGALVPQIEMNLKTGRIKTEVAAPGTIQLAR